MYITLFMTKYYEQNRLVLRLQNKPNSNPIKPNQTQLQKCQNEHKILFNKGL